MTAMIYAFPSYRRILVADGDAGTRALLAAYLRKHGFRVDTVASLAAFRTRVAAACYDLVVVDILVSRERGTAFAEWALGDDAPPVILLSALGSIIDRAAASWIDPDRILAKPCEPSVLLARVRALLGDVAPARAIAAELLPPSA
jgi:two-component system OmpR family response regulator